MVDPKLYTLLEILESGNYTRAAEKLSLTQPAVTQHIKQLEKELDIKIFNRVKNRFVPTAQGNLLIEYARKNIALYEGLQQSLKDMKRQIRRLRVGITHTAESNAVAEVFGKYSLENPGTSIIIISGAINYLYDLLRNYEIDLAVVEGKLSEPGINSVLLDTDSLVFVVSNNHPLAKKRMVSIEEIKKEPLILRSSSSGTRNLFVAHLESKNMSLNEFNLIMEVDNVATIKDLVRRDVGVSILSRSACLDELKKSKMTVLPIENLGMIREINIVYKKGFRHLALVNRIVESYNEVIKSYVS